MNYIRRLNPSIAIIAWAAATCFPLIWVTNPYKTYLIQVDTDRRPAIAAILLLFALSASRLTLNGIKYISPTPNLGTFLAWLFGAYIVTNSTIQGNFLSTIYAIIYLGLLICVQATSRSSAQDRYYQLTSCAILLFLIIARIYLGPPEGRFIGGIHPNIFAGCAVAAAFFALFMRPIPRDLAVMLAMYASYMVDSRYAMLSICALYGTYFALNIAKMGRLRVFAVAIAATVVALAQFMDFSVAGFSGFTHREGLSGREFSWQDFLPQLSERPFFGYGFRSRSSYIGAHNGFLNVILENGVIGGSLFILMYIARGIQLLWALKLAPIEHRSALFAFISGYVCLTIGANLQPQVLNFGDTFGVMSFIILFANPIPYTTRNNHTNSSNTPYSARQTASILQRDHRQTSLYSK
jgi:O-antigen ligase